ncbi:MAG: murein transglycosylase A [Thermodesulfobacteriota bacterium]
MLFLTAACMPETPRVTPPEKPELTARRIEQLPQASDDMRLEQLSTALASSLTYYERLPAEREFAFGDYRFSARDARRVMGALNKQLQSGSSQTALREWIEQHFVIYAVSQAGAPADVLYTGYYMPILSGSRKRGGGYQYPVYGRPRDLVTFQLSDFCGRCPPREASGRVADGRLVPYYSRADLQGSDTLAGRAEPLVFVDDPVDLFFLHIQGSGLVRLPGGGRMHVHYTASNGRPYKSIGRYLIQTGKIARENLSMPSIRAYLNAHPGEREQILAQNPRYVFFEKETGGAKGCLDVELTPGRSAAMDQAVFPSGVLAFIQSRKPLMEPSLAGTADGADPVVGWRDFSRFVLNQDAGSAIRGMGHVDLFWGGGRYAEIAAGRMKHPGKLFILLPQTVGLSGEAEPDEKAQG